MSGYNSEQTGSDVEGESQPRRMRKVSLWGGGLIGFLFVAFFIASAPPAPPPIQFVMTLIFGWIIFLYQHREVIGWGVIWMMSATILIWIATWFCWRLVRRAGGSQLREDRIVWASLWSSLFVVSSMVSGLVVISSVQLAWGIAHHEGSVTVFYGSALRNRSKNVLKQLGISAHNFHDTYHKLVSNRPKKPGMPVHSWETMLLPYLEKTSLYDRIDFDQAWDASENKPIFETELQAFMNRGVDSKFYPSSFDLSKDEQGYAQNHYASNSRVIGFGDGIAFREVKDGLSNTIMMGEVLENFEPWGKPGNGRDPALGIGHPMGFGGPWTFKGCQFLLGDGSVRTISYDISPTVLEQLAIPDDGQVVGEF